MGNAGRKFGNNLPRSDRLNKAQGRQSNTLRSQNITPSVKLRGTPNNEFTKSTGSLHFGADGYLSDALTIASGILDLTTNAAGDIVKVRKNININPESGTADTLDLITTGGTEFPGQEHRIIGQSGDTITITHNSGSAAGNNKAILCPSDTNFTLSDDHAVTLYYDDTLGVWNIDGGSVSAAAAGGGGGGTGDHLFAMYTSSPTVTDPLPMPTSVISSSGTSIVINTTTTDRVTIAGDGARTFKLWAKIGVSATGDSYFYQWYDDTAAAGIGVQGHTRQAGLQVGWEQAYAVVTPAATTDYRLDLISGSGSISSTYSMVYVEEIVGGNVSFPIQPTINNQSSTWTSPVALDLSAVTGHSHKFIIDADLTLTFTSPPATDTQMEFELELAHDGVGGTFTVTLPATVNQLSTISVPLDSRGIYTFRTNDNGATYDVVQIVSGTSGTTTLSGLTIDVSKDWNDKSITNLTALNFSGTGGTGTPTVPQLTVDSTGDMLANVATGDSFFVTQNDVEILEVALDSLEVRTVTADGPDLILRNNDQTPLDNDTVSQILFKGNTDALNSVSYATISVFSDDVSDLAKQADFEVKVQHDNTLLQIIDYTGSNATFRMGGAVDVFRSAGSTCDLGSTGQPWANTYIGGVLNVDSEVRFTAMTAPADLTAAIIYTEDLTNDDLVLNAISSGQVRLDIAGTEAVAFRATAADFTSTGGYGFTFVRSVDPGVPGNVIGKIDFQAVDSGSGGDIYARISAVQTDETAGTEDGDIDFSVSNGGTLTELMSLDGNVLTMQMGGSIDMNANDIDEIGALNMDSKPDITGSRGGNAALADLLTSLATIGLITDSSS